MDRWTVLMHLMKLSVLVLRASFNVRVEEYPASPKSRCAMESTTALMGVMKLIATSVMAVCIGWSMEKRLRSLRLPVLLLNQAMTPHKSTAMETALLNTQEEKISTRLHGPALYNVRVRCVRMENESSTKVNHQ